MKYFGIFYLKIRKKANLKVIFCPFYGDIDIEKVSASPATPIRLKQKQAFSLCESNPLRISLQ